MTSPTDSPLTNIGGTSATRPSGTTRNGNDSTATGGQPSSASSGKDSDTTGSVGLFTGRSFTGRSPWQVTSFFHFSNSLRQPCETRSDVRLGACRSDIEKWKNEVTP